MASDLRVPHSCHICQQLVLESPRLYPRYKKTYFNFVFDFNICDVEHGAFAECELCLWIIPRLEGAALSENQKLYAQLTPGNSHAIETIQFYFGLGDFMNFQYGPSNESSHEVEGKFHIFSEPNDPAAGDVDITNRPINLAPRSNESFRMIKGWLLDCQKNHSKCKDMEVSTMPRRLIEVNRERGLRGQFKLRLRHTSALGYVEFVSLSYCWGEISR
jgi:hypothetical protein